MRRLLPFLALAALLAGCGSTAKNTSSTGGSTPAGASVVRAGVLAFVSADSDLGSGQWQQLDKLAQKFPGRDQAVSKLQQELTKQGVDYQQDVKPALGPEVDLAVVSGGSGALTKAVALTKPDDAGKFKALVAKLNAKDSSGGKAVYQEAGGWYALSDSQAAITDVLKGDRPALADDASFKEAMGKLSSDTLVKAYVDGPRLNALVSETASQGSSGFDSSSLGLDKLKYVAASASAEDDGVRLRGASSGGPSGAGDFASELISGVPGDAFAFLDFKGQGTTDQLKKLKSNPQATAAIAQLQQKLGVTLDQLLSLVGGEVAFYARQGVGIPELTLALAPQSTTAALATLDKVAAHLAAMSGGKVEPGTQGGHPVKTIDLGQFQIHYGGVDGKVLITSGVSGIADYGQGDHLPDSADFKEAQDIAGMPDSTGGFVYLDLKDALPLLEGLASLSGQSLPSSTTENLRPLRSFLAWSNSSGETRTFDAFLEIK
jgi:Protein of unknown function (DUF3352)